MSRHTPGADKSFPAYFLEKSFRGTVHEALQRAHLVSFDVFDTLLRRPFLEPTHLFDALQDTMPGSGFGATRRHAEIQARHRHPSQTDITLDQIYNQLSCGPERELALERELLYPRHEITTWLSIARAKGKKVVAISDTYLPKDFIQQVLDSHRIVVDDLIVSSADGVVKWDSSAFRLAAARHNVRFEEMLHFGDNPHADFGPPVSLGIPAVLVSNKTPRGMGQHHLSGLLAALETNGSHHGSMAGSLIRDSLSTQGPDAFWKGIGRHIVTPLMLGFAQWIRAEAEHHQLKRVAFAARDGKMPRDAYLALQTAKPEDTPYVHLSRAVVLRAGLDTRSEPVLYQLTSGVEAPLSNYITRIGDGVEPLIARARRDFGGDPIVGKDISREELAEFFHRARGELAAIASKARPLLYSYLDQHGLLTSPADTGIADIGWSGTAASVLWDTVPESRAWTWLYFGTRKEYQPSRAKHRAMFFGYGVPEDHHQLVFDCVEIVEFLFSAPETSTIGLRETASGVEPQFAPASSQWEGWTPRVEAMAASFAEALPRYVARTKGNHGLLIDTPTVRTLLRHVVHSSHPDIIREFGMLQHQLGFGASAYEPILPRGRMRYWSNIWRLLRGRELKPALGRRYWHNQLPAEFLLPLKGLKRRIARKALKIHRRGGLFRKRRR